MDADLSEARERAIVEQMKLNAWPREIAERFVDHFVEAMELQMLFGIAPQTLAKQ